MGEGGDELLTLGDPLPYERARRTKLGLQPRLGTSAIALTSYGVIHDAPAGVYRI